MSEKEMIHMRKVIRLTLIQIGIRCDLLGFNYLCYAAELVIQNPKLIHNLCKGLYVKVGKHFHLDKPESVERAIRNAITQTAETKSFSSLNKMLGCKIFAFNDKPTVGELINLVSEYYKLELYKTN